MTFVSKRELDGVDITITICFVNEVSEAEIKVIEFINTIMKECFVHLDLKKIGRSFHNPDEEVNISVTAFMFNVHEK